MARAKKPKNDNEEKRYRNFCTEFYPDSMPENLFEKLADLLIPCFVSPLHNKDINADGEPKKPHYHVELMYSSLKTVDQVKADLDTIGGYVGCFPVKDVRSYSRYLCHLDNPEKAQYNTCDVKMFGGADYFQKISSTADKYQAIREMCQYIEANDILSFRELYLYCQDNRDDWFRALSDNCAMVIREYLKTRFWDIYKKDLEIADSQMRRKSSFGR